MRKTSDAGWILHRGSPTYNEVVLEQGKGRGLKIRVCHQPQAHMSTRDRPRWTPQPPQQPLQCAIRAVQFGSSAAEAHPTMVYLSIRAMAGGAGDSCLAHTPRQICDARQFEMYTTTTAAAPQCTT